LTDDDAAELNQHSGNNKPVDPGSEFRLGPPETLTLPGARDDLRGPQEGQARMDSDPDYRSHDRRDNEPEGRPVSGHCEGALATSPQAATAPDPRQPAAAEIQPPVPVSPPCLPFADTATTAIATPELSPGESGQSRDGRLALRLRRSATILLAAMALCASTVAIGFDHGAPHGEVIANTDLRIVGGHFESIGNFGFGPDGAIGRIIEANGMRLRIDAAAADPHDATGEIMLYRFSRLAANGAATAYCQGDDSGLGFPMAGVWRAGVHTHTPGQISVVCLGTAAARCVALGYRPWRTTADGADLWDYHQACVRALRADYCGSGQSHGDGEHGLALYDRLGIQPLRAADGMSFEAAWDANGASCVNHMRAPARMTLKDLRTECANLPKARLGNSCDERDPALIFTKSPSPSAS
jgi:ADYC domain